MANFREILNGAVARRMNTAPITLSQEPEEGAVVVDPTKHLGLKGKTARLVAQRIAEGEGKQYDLPRPDFEYYLGVIGNPIKI